MLEIPLIFIDSLNCSSLTFQIPQSSEQLRLPCTLLTGISSRVFKRFSFKLHTLPSLFCSLSAPSPNLRLFFFCIFELFYPHQKKAKS
ncbi:hypothetical protein CW304_26935 [Bacillus sp. UFRGS-B20]|nr:hypothetical protein CW304_26935 [Bacillus sp. UFRGS-B20]